MGRRERGCIVFAVSLRRSVSAVVLSCLCCMKEPIFSHVSVSMICRTDHLRDQMLPISFVLSKVSTAPYHGRLDIGHSARMVEAKSTSCLIDARLAIESIFVTATIFTSHVILLISLESTLSSAHCLVSCGKVSL